MTPDDINKYLCKLMGVSVHALDNAPGFFELLGWAKEQEWWNDFYIIGFGLNYDTFPGKVVKFLEERK